MMRRWLGWIGAAVLGLAFCGLFISAGGLDIIPKPPVPTPTPPVLVHGNSGKYLYSISNLTSRDMKRVDFDPSLPADDALVVDVLKSVAKDAYGVTMDESITPVVETINEVNFVTFTVGRTKLLFELFRNSTGGIGAADFSKQQLP